MTGATLKHAWTVLCDKSTIDRDTNNITLNTIEQLVVQLPPFPEGAKGFIINYPFELVTLWYRGDITKPIGGRARIRGISANDEEFSVQEVDIDLKSKSRLRTRIRFLSIPVSSSGVYQFIVEKQSGDKWEEVARVPFQIEIKELKVPIMSRPEKGQSDVQSKKKKKTAAEKDASKRRNN
jgi:hypothetical protein